MSSSLIIKDRKI